MDMCWEEAHQEGCKGPVAFIAEKPVHYMVLFARRVARLRPFRGNHPVTAGQAGSPDGNHSTNPLCTAHLTSRRMFSTLVSASLLVGGCEAASKLIWQQSEDISIYTSASISRHMGKSPTFATATDLNDPIMVEVYNVSDSGENMFSYPDARHGASFTVTMARHTEPSPAAAETVDTLVVNSPPPGVDGCSVYGFDSLDRKSVV